MPTFEYPRRELPEQLHFIGPLLPEANPAPRPWPQDGRPVALVTQGTVATDPEALLVPRLGTPPGPDVRVERLVPYAQVLDHVDVVITNGGYGTIQQALAHGVPIVVAATEDKPEVAARVAWSGAGMRAAQYRAHCERDRA